MIINVRGTGGAGKSYVIRQLMQRYNVTPMTVHDRRQPVGYICQRVFGRPLYVVGHYETPCGGGDTMKTTTEVFEAVDRWSGHDIDVAFEGIISQDDVVRTVELHRRYPLKVLALRVPIEDCLAGIQARRAARGDERQLNPKNTIDRAKRLEGIVSRLRDAGVDCEWVSRTRALELAMEALGLDHSNHGQSRLGEVHAGQ